MKFRIVSYRGLGLAGALLTSIACAASASPALAAKAAKKQELKLMAPYSTNNPAMANASDVYGVDLAYASLIHETAKGTYTPELASSWHYVGKSNKAFSVTLVKGAKFANGSPITAAGVAAWIEYFAKTSSVAGNLGKISSIKVVNKRTLRILEATPDPALPYALSDQSTLGIASAACAKTPTLFTSNPAECSSGEYVYVPSQSVPAVHALMVPNKHYFDLPAVQFSSVYIGYIADPASAVQALDSGQFNVIEGAGTTASSAQSAGKAIYSGGTQLQANLTLDASGAVSKPLGNVKVRQAINYALNRAAIAKVWGGAYAKPTDELITADGYDPKLNGYYNFDLAKAKQLMAQAGYSNGFTLNNVIEPTFAPQWTDVTAVVQQELSEIGITVNTTPYSQLPAWIGAIASSTTSPMALVAGQPTPMSIEYSTDIPFANHFGGTGWHDNTLQSYYNAGITSKNPQQDWVGITDRIVKQAYFAPLLVQKVILFANKNVKGIQFTPTRVLATPTEWSFSS